MCVSTVCKYHEINKIVLYSTNPDHCKRSGYKKRPFLLRHMLLSETDCLVDCTAALGAEYVGSRQLQCQLPCVTNFSNQDVQFVHPGY
jgi:hypothetical protein